MQQSIREVVADGIIQQYDIPRPKKYWQRNKKQTVNYVYDSPFATERQLEDQRLLQLKNRNPQYYVPTKVEKVRSEVMIQKQGASRAIAVKANVVNKIVREASGVYQYTIIAPPKAKKGEKQVEEKIDPETHPLMAPYAKEAKSKPIIVSFGHRPRSASRTFHPASMRFKLSHDEVVKARGAQSGFGLPVSVLSKVLNAPKIYSESEILDQMDAADKAIGTSSAVSSNYDPNNLFFTEQEEHAVFGGSGASDASEDDSWISSIEKRQLDKKSSKKIVKLQPINEQRPAWDEAFFLIKMTTKERLALKESVILKGEILPLKERCKRFAMRSVADPPEMYCSEKQELDRRVMAGETLTVPKAVPQKKEYPIWYDPYDENLAEVNKIHQKRDRKMKRAQKAWKYQEDLCAIPKSTYFPTTALAEMRSKSTASNLHNTGNTNGSSVPFKDAYSSGGSSSQEEGSYEEWVTALEDSTTRDITTNSSEGLHLRHVPVKPSKSSRFSGLEYVGVEGRNSGGSSPASHKSPSSKYSPNKSPSRILDDGGEWVQFEKDLKNAVKAAKRGDTSALYNFTMKPRDGAESDGQGPYRDKYGVNDAESLHGHDLSR